MPWTHLRGKPMPPEQRAKIAAAHLGKRHTAETRAKMSAAKKGRPVRPLSPENKAKLIAANLGKVVSAESRAKMRAAKLGRPNAWRGKKRGPIHTPESRRAISLANKGRPAAWPLRRFYYKDIPFRSSYEVRVAKAFDALGIAWEYESRRFDISETETYCPDFWLAESSSAWEVKGWFGPKSQRTMRLFRAAHPDIPVVVATINIIEQLEAATFRKVA